MTNPCDFSDEELLALLRDPSVSPAAIEEEMEGAGAGPCPAAHLELARTLLATFDETRANEVAALPARLSHLLLEQAVAARAAAFVTALCASADKALSKDAKRALHRLRAGGLKVEAPRPAPPPPQPAANADDELVAYMTSVDGAHGERLLFHPCPVPGGVDVAQVILSDETGIHNAELAPLGKRRFRRFVEMITSNMSLLVGPVPRAYSRSLIARSLDLNAVARRSVPGGFNDVAFALGPTPPTVRSPGRGLATPDDAPTLASEARALELLAARHFTSWVLPDSVARSLPGDDDAAPQQRALLTFWTPQRRALWAERLFDMAWLLHGADRTEDRDVALACAASLEQELPPDEVGFARALFARQKPTN